MAWTYSGDPASSDRDAVRFWTQDTDREFQLLPDEGLDYLLANFLPQQGHVLGVAAIACEVIASKFAREINVSADGVSVALSDLQTKYNELALSLRAQLHAMNPGNEALALMLDTTESVLIPPLVFGIGFMDNYEAGQQDYGQYSPGDDPWSEETTSGGL